MIAFDIKFLKCSQAGKQHRAAGYSDSYCSDSGSEVPADRRTHWGAGYSDGYSSDPGTEVPAGQRTHQASGYSDDFRQGERELKCWQVGKHIGRKAAQLIATEIKMLKCLQAGETHREADYSVYCRREKDAQSQTGQKKTPSGKAQ